MTLTESHANLEAAITELEVSPQADLLRPLALGARELLEGTTPDDDYPEAECVADLRAVVAALSIWKAAIVRAHQGMQA